MIYYLKMALKEANDGLNYTQRLHAEGGESKAAVRRAQKRVKLIQKTMSALQAMEAA